MYPRMLPVTYSARNAPRAGEIPVDTRAMLRPPDMPPDATDVNNPRSFSSLKTFWGATVSVPVPDRLG